MGQKQIINFVHGNGFTAGTYTKLFNLLEDKYKVIAIDKLGHNPRYPVDENWASITNELISYIEKNSGEPVIGVGHSLGSILTFIVAQRRPDLFTRIVIVDPPLFYGPFAIFLKFMKISGIVNKIGLAARTVKRRTEWSSLEEAEAFFRQRIPFNNFDLDCLKDYVKYGTADTEKGIRLIYDTNVESNIFKTTPHNLGAFQNKLAVPGMLIIGDDTYISTRYTAEGFAKRFGMNYHKFEGGNHFFPFVYPERTAVLIKDVINII